MDISKTINTTIEKTIEKTVTSEKPLAAPKAEHVQMFENALNANQETTSPNTDATKAIEPINNDNTDQVNRAGGSIEDAKDMLKIQAEIQTSLIKTELTSKIGSKASQDAQMLIKVQ